MSESSSLIQEQDDVNTVAFIDYTRQKISNLERSKFHAATIITFSVIQIFGVLQMNLPDRPKDQILVIQKMFLSAFQMNEVGWKCNVFMGIVYFFIFLNIMSTLYIVNYIKNNDNNLPPGGRALLIFDKLLNFVFNWVIIVPLT